MRFNQKGYTLIELMAVTGILVIVGMGFYNIRCQHTIARINVHYRQHAIELVKSQADFIRASAFEDIDDTILNSIQTDYPELFSQKDKCDIKVTLVSKNLKRIDLKIAWEDARQTAQSIPLTVYKYRK